jgi:hypothetical protein
VRRFSCQVYRLAPRISREYTLNWHLGNLGSTMQQ